MCTLRKSWAKGAIHELFWIMNGSTDVNDLNRKGVHVWDANTSRSALDAYGFKDRPEKDIGPSYGFNLRHFGADYQGFNYDYSGLGKD